MYRFAFIGYIISFLLSTVLATVLMVPHIDEIKALNEDIAPFHAYLDRGGATILIDTDGRPYSPEVVKRGAQAEKELMKLQTDIQLKTCWFIPLHCLVIGLLGDALYKMHIIKNSQNKNGGVSVSSLVCGRLLFSVIDAVAFSPLFSLVTIILIR